MNYVKKNDEILQKFRELERIHPLESSPQEIGEDGLMYRGGYFVDEYGNNVREPGNEEQMWHECKCRVMFVTKDVNGNVYDIRRDPFLFTENFYKKMAYVLYGFHHIMDGKALPYDAIDAQMCKEYYEIAPLVRINCKKTAGGASITKEVFDKYTTYSPERKVLLVEQIKMWKPDVIVSSGFDTVYEFLHQSCFTKWKNKSINGGDSHYIYTNDNILVINANHPSYLESCRNYYKYVMSAFEDAIERHPAFRARVI